MKYVVIQSHTSNYPEPISLEKGDQVRVGNIYSGPENWNNWVYCRAEHSGLVGWVPEQIITCENSDSGIVLETYTAKELNVEKGDILIGLKELNGWLWCKKIECEEVGWIPKVNVRLKQKMYFEN
ncbi:SH3 domain-containing protein [Bacillus pseudomycoides]|uniref:SH3 domain-containing protein n=1 Tax=Bacillus pseudomycoides TaxID=64104 RepID=UPI000BF733BB|nr:SH3 domain-containing protein [Bacillus pseudomycoides]PEP75432.1 ligand-binding protein SH3 [Bacillus pseudomycoides]